MRKIKKIGVFLLIAITIGIWPVFAQDSDAAPEAKTLDLEVASDDELTQALNKADDIELINKEDNLSGNDGDNEYLEESRRLTKRAEEAFSEGDYDTSAKLANDATALAVQSDVNVAITEVKRRLDEAAASTVSVRLSNEYREAENWYKQSIKARDNEEWEVAINAASRAAQLLDGLGTSDDGPIPLPATYTVRSWSVSKDCFWNIAGFPWVYGNPRQWRLLYNANKSKLPNPNNPNVIEPGTVLDIPSIKGEVRQGAWESGKTYEPLK